MRIRLFVLALISPFAVLFASVPVNASETAFKFGGYIKFDANHSYYHNGDVEAASPLRDFHIPAAIPLGSDEKNFDTDYHVKESRFNFTTVTRLADGSEIKGFLELDFLLSPAGNERVSNSFNPRLRHFYFSTDPWLVGQTWSTFQIVVLPDNLDFIGAADGVVFIRQPQIRLAWRRWQVSLENPETVVSTIEAGARLVTESSGLPDVVLRYDIKGGWGSVGIAGIGRQLHYDDPTESIKTREYGYGLTAGGELKIGGNDLKLAGTLGHGLGRYVALNFANAAAVDSTGEMTIIDEAVAFIAYRHFWNEKWRSTIDASVCYVDNPSQLPGSANDNAQSASATLLYSPNPKLTLGVEYMHAWRELKDGTKGQLDRIQFSARYDFGWDDQRL
jgi:hypothetical protein